MRRRDKTVAFLLALQLVWRVWRMSRRTGIPFQTLLNTHLEMMRIQVEIAIQAVHRQAVHEQHVAQIARNN